MSGGLAILSALMSRRKALKDHGMVDQDSVSVFHKHRFSDTLILTKTAELAPDNGDRIGPSEQGHKFPLPEVTPALLVTFTHLTQDFRRDQA